MSKDVNRERHEKHFKFYFEKHEKKERHAMKTHDEGHLVTMLDSIRKVSG